MRVNWKNKISITNAQARGWASTRNDYFLW